MVEHNGLLPHILQWVAYAWIHGHTTCGFRSCQSKLSKDSYVGCIMRKGPLMSWVVVVPKVGWTGSPSILLLVRHRLFKFFFWKFLFWFVFKIFFILFQKKDGRVTRPSFFWYDTNSGHRDLFAYRRPCGLSTCQSPRRSPSLTAPFILFHIICGSLARSLTHSAHSGQI